MRYRAWKTAELLLKGVKGYYMSTEGKADAGSKFQVQTQQSCWFKVQTQRSCWFKVQMR